MKLLSIQNDAKTSKSVNYGYLTAIQYFAPYTLSGKNICPAAKQHKCHIACLNTAGRGKFSSVQNARVNRTRFFLENKNEYFQQLDKEIESLKRKADRMGLKPSIRLNGTSDIRWEKYDVIENHGDVQFYDYTKISTRKNKDLPENYHLTYSFSGAYPQWPENYNWAMVFDGDAPEEFHGRKTIDGDEHDLRFLDPDGVVVALKAKGKAKKDDTGFVIREPTEKGKKNGV